MLWAGPVAVPLFLRRTVSIALWKLAPVLAPFLVLAQLGHCPYEGARQPLAVEDESCVRHNPLEENASPRGLVVLAPGARAHSLLLAEAAQVAVAPHASVMPLLAHDVSPADIVAKQAPQ